MARRTRPTRDYAADYARRQKHARAAGFRSYWHYRQSEKQADVRIALKDAGGDKLKGWARRSLVALVSGTAPAPGRKGSRERFNFYGKLGAEIRNAGGSPASVRTRNVEKVGK